MAFNIFSKEYRLNNPEIFKHSNTKTPYLLEDFIHSFSELSNIEFENFDKTKSIFNAAFINTPRLILIGVDYDKR